MLAQGKFCDAANPYVLASEGPIFLKDGGLPIKLSGQKVIKT